MTEAKPFIKWVSRKTQLLTEINNVLFNQQDVMFIIYYNKSI